MPVYHIVLFKLKPTTTTSQLIELDAAAKTMVGAIPGLLRISLGPPMKITAHRSQGFDYGLVAVLEKPENVEVYGGHEAHLKVHKLREALCDDTLAYDVEFD